MSRVRSWLMATRLLANGSEFQINVDDGSGSGVAGSQLLPQATAINDGRFVISYESDHLGSSSSEDAVFRLLSSSINYEAVSGSIQGNAAVTARVDGGFAFVFSDIRGDLVYTSYTAAD